MQINWFPGHMAKSMRMIEESVKLSSVIIYVLDARAPFSCINPSFNNLIKNKKVLYLLNKSDLADQEKLKNWLTFFISKDSLSVAIDSTKMGSGKIVLSKLRLLCSDKIKESKERGFKKSIRAMVIGIPNCGKSTLVNNLCGRSKAATGDKAGVTRGKQWVNVSNEFDILDTPGTLYPKLDNQIVASRLAYIGSINDDILDIDDIALGLISEIIALYPGRLKERYDIINLEKTPEEILEHVAKKRGFLKKDNLLDISLACKAILYDFRKGKLGKITFEEADDYDKRII